MKSIRKPNYIPLIIVTIMNIMLVCFYKNIFTPILILQIYCMVADRINKNIKIYSNKIRLLYSDQIKDYLTDGYIEPEIKVTYDELINKECLKFKIFLYINILIFLVCIILRVCLG